MKRFFGLAMLLMSGSAVAEMALVAPSGSLCAGQVVRESQFIHVLSKTRSCNLPIVHAKEMHAFRSKSPISAEVNGCWGRTLGNKILLISSSGYTSTMPAEVFAEADLDRKNGTGRVISSVAEQKGWIKCH